MVKKISSLKAFTRKSFRTLKISPKSCFSFFLLFPICLVFNSFCGLVSVLVFYMHMCMCVCECVRAQCILKSQEGEKGSLWEGSK